MTASVDYLRARVQIRREALREAHEVKAAILLHKRARLADLAKDTSHSREWLQKRERDIRAEAQKALDRVDAASAEQMAEIEEYARKAAEKPVGSTQDQILEQLQIQNAWLSVKQILDTAAKQADPLSAIEQSCASAANDPVKFQALKHFSGDWFTASFGKLPNHSQDNIRKAMTAGIERVESSQRTELQAAGHEILQELERGRARVEENSRAARAEIADYSNRREVPALAAWDDDTAHVQFRDNRGAFPAEAVSAAFGPRARAWAIAARRDYRLLAGTADDTPAGAAGIIARMGGQLAEPPANDRPSGTGIPGLPF